MATKIAKGARHSIRKKRSITKSGRAKLPSAIFEHQNGRKCCGRDEDNALVRGRSLQVCSSGKSTMEARASGPPKRTKKEYAGMRINYVMHEKSPQYKNRQGINEASRLVDGEQQGASNARVKTTPMRLSANPTSPWKASMGYDSYSRDGR